MKTEPSSSIQLIVGLGNPGDAYIDTRHNVGFWIVDALAMLFHGTWKPEKKMFGLTARITIDGNEVHLLKPMLFMNRSGQSVQAFCAFFKIDPSTVLVIHDDLDLPVGISRLKQGGGHGGHNGLRNVINHFSGNKMCKRLRIGIGHPGVGRDVAAYVLKKPTLTETAKIKDIIEEILCVFPNILKSNQWQHAMQRLHSFSA